MNFVDYALHHIACVARLLRGDTSAFADMDISADGFWRSFEAIPAALPALLFAWVVEARQLQASDVSGSLATMIAKMAVLQIVFWIVPVIAYVFVLRLLKLGHRYVHLIVARNWLDALTSYLFVVVPISEVVARGSGIAGWLSFLVIVVVLWFSVRTTRAALNVSQYLAVALVATEAAITYPFAITFYALAGLLPTQ